MGEQAPQTPPPVSIRLRRRSRLLEVRFDTGETFELPLEYLRVHSPSAEVKGHGPGQGRVVPGKQDVGIERIEPVGNYAVRLCFDDGHASGLYSWRILYDLGRNRERYWQDYLRRLESVGMSRRAD